MTSILLIYPFFLPRHDRSVFRFPPLGISYIASTLMNEGHEVQLMDCTFLGRDEAFEKASVIDADVIGIYCMVSMFDDCIRFAQNLRSRCQLLVVGGPLPTCDPEPFLQYFDVVVRGEGEQTMLELLRVSEKGDDFHGVPGIVYKSKSESNTKKDFTFTPDREFSKDLDRIPFPARALLPNDDYIRYGKKKYGYSITSLMSTRGCPYRCEFCSNVIFGGSYRERSAENVVDEIEEALYMGYEHISFSDDVFTMKKDRVIEFCQEIKRRDLHFQWECLGRVDSLDHATALEMKSAGCKRIYFGIESANEQILRLMNKGITAAEARNCVEATHRAGIDVGAFFILGYPGDTDDTVLETLHFATTLPLDYLGLSMPYPLPGTDLYTRIKGRITRDWHPEESPFGSHVLIFNADFSEMKMWFGIIKGHTQFWIQKKTGRIAPIILYPFEKLTNGVFRLLK
jgi:anaerobic magnesium-protoporphyrin IX monomethyl ester cyclase